MSREEDAPRDDATWKNQLPYAYEYIQEVVLHDAEHNPDFPQRWDVQSRGVLDEPKLKITGWDGPSVVLRTSPCQASSMYPICYWEVELTTSMASQSSMRETKAVGIGFHDDEPRLRTFVYSENVPEPMFDGEDWQKLSFDAKNILGCGLHYPYGLFFTKNGLLVDCEFIDLDVSTSYSACIQINRNLYTTITLEANFGRKPFSFDVVAYCKSSSDRSRRPFSALPMEVIEDVVAFMLLAVEKDINSEDPIVIRDARRTLSRISGVCRRWCILCRRHIFRSLTLTSKADIGYATSQPSLWSSRHLSTHEGPYNPWIHCLLPSALPRRFISLEKWDYISSRFLIFNERFPAGISHAMLALLRCRCFASMTRLSLLSLRFPNWLQFARFVLSIQQLDELILEDVRWDHNELPPNPPSWIRFSRRIRRIVIFDDLSHFGTHGASGLFCLLFAGRRDTSSASIVYLDLTLLPEDIGIIANVTQALFRMVPNFDNLLCEQTSPTSCTLICSWDNHDPALVLRFARRHSERAYKLVHITTTIDRDYNLTEADSKLLADLLPNLSNHPGYSHCIVVRELHATRTLSTMDQPIYDAFWNEFRATWASCEAEDHVLIWAIPFEVRDSPPLVKIAMRRSVPDETVNIGVPVQFPVRNIVNIGLGVAYAILPVRDTLSVNYFDLVLNGQLFHTEPLRLKPYVPQDMAALSSENL